ncbi:MAG TPA: polysaccharide biosynthesis/export family protein [Pyrinomonadaceae bacterium]|jgi:protein involved in polysaccharide export with SLBB domain
MKSNPTIAALSLALLLFAPAAASAQKKKDAKQKSPAAERLEPDDKSVARPGVPEEALANRRERKDEEAEAEIPYYNNFLTSYRLGPEDVISIKVFGGPNVEKYSMTGITVPPDGTIDYYFVSDGLQVAGKTTRQVRDEIVKHLDEYIIEPKVTVSLEKAMSMRYGVLGDVAQPGVRIMSRRLSAYEAIIEAGGILSTGKSQVYVLHWNADRTLRQTPIDIAAIQKGKAPDNYFLSPGDQIFVPGNKWKRVESIIKLAPILSFARIFSGGF